MNWLTILFSYLISIQANKLNIEKIYFLENNFWKEDQINVETDKGFLRAVSLSIWKENTRDRLAMLATKCYIHFNCANRAYALLDGITNDQLSSYLKSKDLKNTFLNITSIYFETLEEDEEEYEFHPGRVRIFNSYIPFKKILGKDNSITLQDEIQMCIYHIKHLFAMFSLVETRLLTPLPPPEEIEEMVNDFKKVGGDQFVLFGFNYFKGWIDCIQGIKDFFNTLCYLELIKDDDTNSLTKEFSGMSIKNKNTMTASEFVKRLIEKNNSTKLTGSGASKTTVNNPTGPLFNKCVDFIKNLLLDSRLTLLIGGKFNIDFYIEGLYNVIIKTIEKIIEKHGNFKPEQETKIFEDEFGLDNEELEKLKTAANYYFCETDFLPNYFSKVLVLGRKIKTLNDYNTIEKMLCDFNNTAKTILNMAILAEDKMKSNLHPYNEPAFRDNYNYKIVEGIKITTAENVMPVQVKAFDKKGQEVELEDDEDCFARSPECNKIFFVGKVLEMNNIHEVEIVCIDEKFGFVVERIKIDKYLGC